MFSLSRDLPQSIQLQLLPSKRLLILLVALHLMAVLALLLSALDFVLTSFLVLAVVIHLYHSYRQDYCLDSPNGVTALVVAHDGLILHRRQAGLARALPVELVGRFRRLSWFISIRMREKDSRRCHDLAFFSDSADDDQLRRFRVWLGLYKTNAADSSDSADIADEDGADEDSADEDSADGSNAP